MSAFRDRIGSLADRARADREAFDPPADPPDEERALAYVRDGVGDVVACYVDARTGDLVALDREEMALLERALNDWLELYARCYGRRIEAAFTVREVAELVVDTRDVVDAAQLLTGVPPRETVK
jgi:AcrR family transcriptional regulator